MPDVSVIGCSEGLRGNFLHIHSSTVCVGVPGAVCWFDPRSAHLGQGKKNRFLLVVVVMGSSLVALRQAYADELSEKVEKGFVMDASPEGQMFVKSGPGGFG